MRDHSEQQLRVIQVKSIQVWLGELDQRLSLDLPVFWTKDPVGFIKGQFSSSI